jgi:hypothetical protein
VSFLSNLEQTRLNVPPVVLVNMSQNPLTSDPPKGARFGTSFWRENLFLERISALGDRLLHQWPKCPQPIAPPNVGTRTI